MTSNSKRALLSVSDKTDLVPFAQSLVELGFELLSTGGTRKALEQAGLPVIDVAEYTGFPEMMSGRVKTLHPKVHGGLLGRPDLPDDAKAMSEHGIQPFQLVVVNLYPFEATVAKPDVSLPEAIEQIDIGGPSMLRSAAKNHKYVGVVTSAAQYNDVLTALKQDCFDEAFRRQLALAAFEMTARYDTAISSYLAKEMADADAETPFTSAWQIGLTHSQTLRYGENPHQQAAFYTEPQPPQTSLANAVQKNGKELSYNNILDLDAALAIAREFERPALAILKHNNPCGCGLADDLATAFEKAYEGDPVSAFGCIIGANRSIDLETAKLMCRPGQFIEAIIAPGYDEEAFEYLTTTPKWKKNVRLLEVPWSESRDPSWEYRRVSGGMLIQSRDDQADPEDKWEIKTARQPTEAELIDLKFAWVVCKHVKSNAIVFAKDGAITGVGAGQMSRLDSATIAAQKAGEKAKGGVVASDAFFPFRDGIDQAAGAGIVAAIQPGGSVKDEEVITAANEHEMAMVFTGRRHFRH